MSELIKVQNLEQPKVQELLNKFKKRHEMNVVEVAEIISELITTLRVDHEEGRHKAYSISVGHLGEVLGIGKGVISQFMSVWSISQESKDFLRKYNLSLINAYHVSRIKGKDEKETIKFQKEEIIKKSTSSSVNSSGKRIDILLHAINEAQMILSGIVVSYKIPKEIFQVVPEKDLNLKANQEFIIQKAKIYKYNIEQCINYLSPKISKLSYLKKELEFCNEMLEKNETRFCGKEITIDCLNKQIRFVSDEIISIELEYKLPHIASLLMMKNNLEKNM